MQAIHETEIYSNTAEHYEDENYQEYEESSEASNMTGAGRVLRLGLILLLLVLAAAFIFFVLLPAIQNMIQPPLPPLVPALQV
jgi:hypothetical protein